MLTPAEADAAIAAVLGQVPEQELPLAACAGRVLRREVRAERDAPPFDRVAMDGIAFAAAAGARRSFRVAGVQAAGAPPLTLPSADACIEVMTGAMLPLGCDTVVPVERIGVADGTATLESGYAPAPWQHVHRRASDALAGDVLLVPGTRLGAPEIAIAASAGLARLAVSRLPRIAVISTGDELVEPGLPVLDHQIRRSNSHGLAAALALAGFAPAIDRHLPDDEAELQRSLALDSTGMTCSASGGVLRAASLRARHRGARRSTGVPPVAHRPALWFDPRARRPVFASSAVRCGAGLPCALWDPALVALSGAGARAERKASLARPFEFNAPLTCFLPVTLRYDQDGRALAEPRPTGGSGDFISLAGTDGFVELPPGPAIHPAGLAVPFHRW
jgi:molybdopterin molybdotransferase